MLIRMPADVNDGIKKMGCCGIVAVSVACNVPFIDVWKYIGKNKRGNWKGSVTIHEMLCATEKFSGKRAQRIPYEFSRFYGRPISEFSAYVALTQPNSIFIVLTRDHLQTVQGMNVADQQGVVPMSKYWARRRKVVDIFVVEQTTNPIDIQSSQIKEKEMTDTVNSEKKVSKLNRARVLVPELIALGKDRKAILAQMVNDLETTWGAASTFYHQIQRENRTKKPDPIVVQAESEIAPHVVSEDAKELAEEEVSFEGAFA